MRSAKVPSRTALVLIIGVTAAACSTASDDSDANADASPADTRGSTESQQEAAWPENDITIVVPSDTGGAYDIGARNLQAPLERQLGVNVIVDNRPGGNNAVGQQTVANEGDECDVLLNLSTPNIVASYMTQDVDYTYDDFAPVGTHQLQPGTVLVSTGSPYDTLEDLLEDVRQRPGEVVMSLPSASGFTNFGIIELEEKLELEFNKVVYDGGGASRTAVMSGEADVTYGPLFASLDFADELRNLAVHHPENEWPEVTDAPSLEEATGVEFEPNGALHVLLATSNCRNDYPDRFQRLVDALAEAVQDPEYLAALEEQGSLDALYYLPPDEVDRQIRDSIPFVERVLRE